MPRTTTFRLDDETLDRLERLSKDLGLTKTSLVVGGVATIETLLGMAAADVTATLDVIRERHPDAQELTIDLLQVDGKARAFARIDGDEYAEIGARAVIVDDTAHLFLQLPEGKAELVQTFGNEVLLIRPQYPVGRLPWPPQNLRIVLRLAPVDAAAPSTTA
jgi:predicted transcriptional regulator